MDRTTLAKKETYETLPLKECSTDWVQSKDLNPIELADYMVSLLLVGSYTLKKRKSVVQKRYPKIRRELISMVFL